MPHFCSSFYSILMDKSYKEEELFLYSIIKTILELNLHHYLVWHVQTYFQVDNCKMTCIMVYVIAMVICLLH